MKRSKTLLLTVTLVLLVATLASCGLPKSHKSVFDGSLYADKAPSPTAAAKVEALLGAAAQTQKGDLVHLTDVVIDGENTHQKNIVYNLATNAVVLQATATLTTSIEVTLGTTYQDVSYFLVKTTTWQLNEGVEINRETKTALCAADGTVLGEGKGVLSATTTLDLLCFDNKCYRVTDDGSITQAFNLSDFSTLPALTAKTDTYYYNVTKNSVFVYNVKCDLTAHYTMPDYAYSMFAYPLEGGDVLVQYLVAEPDDAKDYTFLLPTSYSYAAPGKYTLHSLLLNAKRNTTQKLDLDCLVLGVINATSENWQEKNGLADKYDNIATVARIEDKRMNTAASAYSAVVLTNGGKLKGELKELVLAQTTVLPVMVAQNRWTVTNSSGQVFLVNEKGNVIGEITGNDARNESYYLAGGKIYDYSLTSLYDYKGAKLSVFAEGENAYKGVMNHGVLLVGKDGEVVCYANGAATTVIAKDTARTVEAVSDSYFIVCDATDTANVKYEVYNDVGTKVTTLDYKPTVVSTLKNGAVLLSYLQADGKCVYCRIA